MAKCLFLSRDVTEILAKPSFKPNVTQPIQESCTAFSTRARRCGLLGALLHHVRGRKYTILTYIPLDFQQNVVVKKPCLNPPERSYL